MYRQTSITTRPSTSAEFWLQSTNMPPGYRTYSNSYGFSGILLNFSYNISSDGLTMTRILDFKDQASAGVMFADYAAQFPTAMADKASYESAHGHVTTITYSTV